MKKDYIFIKPITTEENISKIYQDKKSIFENDKSNLNLIISKLKKRTLSNSEYSQLVDIGLIEKYDTKDLFDTFINEGRRLKDLILKIEEKHSSIPRGYNHLEITLQRFKKDIFSKTLINDINDILLKYNHSIFDDFKDFKTNYSSDEQFIIFIYETYEILELYISMLNDDLADKTIYKYYYYDIFEYDFEKILDNYLNKYKILENINFQLIKNNLDIQNIGELEEYDICLYSDKIASAIIFELKNTISSITTKSTYSICTNCHNLYRKSKSNQEFCKNKECLKERDRNDLRHKNNNKNKSIN